MDSKYGPQQNYKVTAVPLDGGLDFVSPPSMVRPGTLTDCLNYEVVDRNGYRRVDGYYRWDNAYEFEDDRPYYIQVTETAGGASAVGDFLTTFDTTFSDNTGFIQERVFGLLLDIVPPPDVGEPATLVYMRLASRDEPGPGENVSTLRTGPTLWTCVSAAPQLWPSLLPLAIPPADGSTSNGASLLYPSSDKDYGTDRPTIGLKYFNDKAYKITDAFCATCEIPDTTRLYAGDVIGDENGAVIVLKATGNDFVGSGTEGYNVEVAWLGGRTNTGGVDLDYVHPFHLPAFFNPVLARTGQAVTNFTYMDTSLYRPTNAVLYEAERLDSLFYARAAGRLGEGLVNNAGTCTAPPTVSITGGNGFGAKAVAIWDSTNGVRGLALTSAGSGYGSPLVTINGAGTAAGGFDSRSWQWAGWRAINTGWRFAARNCVSASGFLTKVDRTRGPRSQEVSYSTGSSKGLCFGLDGQLQATGVPPVNVVAQFGVTTDSDPTILHTADANRVEAGLRSSVVFGPFSTTPFGMRDFTSVKENIPTGSVITGFEFNFTYYTSDFDSNTPPDANDLAEYRACAALYKKSFADNNVPQYELISDVRKVDLTPNATAEGPVAVTIGAADDLWGVDGATIDEITPDIGVVFWLEFVPRSGYSFGYKFEIDTADLDVNYRSPQVSYYFSGSGSTDGNVTEGDAGGAAVQRNVYSATLVNYHRSNGELTQGNWAGDWQVADLGVEKYCGAGSVGLIKITNQGGGYETPPTVSFTGAGSGATATAVIEEGKVVGVIITNAGTGCDGTTGVTFSAPPAGPSAVTATGSVIVGALPGIQSGMGIYLDENLTTRVGFVSSDMGYNGLDSYTALEEEGSRYQIISANFYSDEAWEGIYGVSGAGRAWYFDGNYFSRIYAIPLDVEDSERKDKPRSICNYRYHLALGYRSGSVLFSVIGEPENFSGVEGAAEVGIGDRVTGIFPLPGQYLAVFCENSIWGIAGKTTSEFSLENISPYSGAIEYSIVAIGDKPIYCDTMGISTLEQSDKYGNFLGTRLSHKISPWLLPRLTGLNKRNFGVNTSGLITAYAVRAKNQYRLWFKDGYQLVLSFVGPEQEPQFTFMRYLFGGTDAGGTRPETILQNITDNVYLSAIDSDVDRYGNEQVIAAFDLKRSEVTGLAQQRLLRPAIHKLEYLNQFGDNIGFAGENEVYRPLAIPAYIQTAFSTVENPFARKTVRKIRLEGTSRGRASVSILTEKNYSTPEIGTAKETSCALNRVEVIPATDPNDFAPASNIGNVAESDRVIAVKLAHFIPEKKKELRFLVSSYGGEDTYRSYYVTKVGDPLDGEMDAEPAHYIQLMLVQYEEGRQDA
jgi:hypothetical protein